MHFKTYINTREWIFTLYTSKNRYFVRTSGHCALGTGEWTGQWALCTRHWGMDWTVGTGHWALGTGHWALDTGTVHWALDTGTGHWAVSTGHWAVGTGQSLPCLARESLWNFFSKMMSIQPWLVAGMSWGPHDKRFIGLDENHSHYSAISSRVQRCFRKVVKNLLYIKKIKKLY